MGCGVELGVGACGLRHSRSTRKRLCASASIPISSVSGLSCSLSGVGLAKASITCSKVIVIFLSLHSARRDDRAVFDVELDHVADPPDSIP